VTTVALSQVEFRLIGFSLTEGTRNDLTRRAPSDVPGMLLSLPVAEL